MENSLKPQKNAVSLATALAGTQTEYISDAYDDSENKSDNLTFVSEKNIYGSLGQCIKNIVKRHQEVYDGCFNVITNNMNNLEMRDDN